MAVVIRIVLLSLSLQSLHAASNSTTASSTTVNGTTTPTASGDTVSTATNETLSTQTSTEATSTSASESNQSTQTSSGSMATTPGSTGETLDVNSTSTAVVSAASTEVGTAATPTAAVTTSSEGQMLTGLETPSESTTTVATAETTTLTPPMTPEATTSDRAPMPETVSLAVYIAVGVVSGLLVLVLLFALGVWCMRRGKHRSGRRNQNPFDRDAMDKLDPRERMSMHRPVSATENAEADLAFVTFGTGSSSPGSHVDGIENPTYALSTIGNEKEAVETKAGEGGNVGAATMPSSARLNVVASDEGDVEGLKDKGVDSKAIMRPQSGVSYTSNDIDGALETLDVGTV